VSHLWALWHGPNESDLKTDGVSLVGPVPDERWPYGPPSYHETCCRLHRMRDQSRTGGLYCDCKASEASDTEFGGAP
jgi:hypothetical protein